MDKLRFGIVGAGGIAAILHLPELARMPQAQVVHIAGRKESRLRHLCAQYAIPRFSQDYEAVIADEAVDAVIVATPHPLHVVWGLRAMEAGKHVLMQKPLCGDMGEADAFVQAAEKTRQTVLCMPHFGPHVYALRELCRQGKIGRVSGARCRTSHGGPEVYYAGVRQLFGEQGEDLWFFDAGQASVGALFDMGVYAVATLVAILGTVKKVAGMTTTFDKPTQLEDVATLVLQMESGGLATAETSWCDPARTRELLIHGTAGKYTLPGADGAELSCWTPTSYTDERAPVRREAVQVGTGKGTVHEHFLECVREGRQPPLSHAWAARHVTEILLAGLQAGQSGRAVELRTRAEGPA